MSAGSGRNTSTLGTGPSLYPHVGYEPRKDFSPLGLVASSLALVLVGAVRSPFADMQSQSKPGTNPYGKKT
jgi:hypothetical protein